MVFAHWVWNWTTNLYPLFIWYFCIVNIFLYVVPVWVPNECFSIKWFILLKWPWLSAANSLPRRCWCWGLPGASLRVSIIIIWIPFGVSYSDPLWILHIIGKGRTHCVCFAQLQFLTSVFFGWSPNVAVSHTIQVHANVSGNTLEFSVFVCRNPVEWNSVLDIFLECIKSVIVASFSFAKNI